MKVTLSPLTVVVALVEVVMGSDVMAGVPAAWEVSLPALAGTTASWGGKSRRQAK
jgi:hypothetical protein